MRSFKQTYEFWSSHYQNLLDIVNEKFNDVKSLVTDISHQVSTIDSKYTDILDLVDQINSKLTEDTIDRLNTLGTADDFDLGFYDGFNNFEHGHSSP
jgi:hypothetical protein